jgi:hypothetical protein
MRDALRIQDRFVPEPLFARTGRSYLKSEGVSTLQKIKSKQRGKSAHGFNTDFETQDADAETPL